MSGFEQFLKDRIDFTAGPVERYFKIGHRRRPAAHQIENPLFRTREQRGIVCNGLRPVTERTDRLHRNKRFESGDKTTGISGS